MVLKTKQELKIANIVNLIRLHLKTEEISYLDTLDNVVTEAILKDGTDFINSTYDILQELNSSYSHLFSEVLNSNIEIQMDDKNTYILMAIPIIFMNYKSMTNIPYCRNYSHFNTNIGHIKVKLEKLFNQKLKNVTKYPAHVRFSPNLLSVQQLEKDYLANFRLNKDLFKPKHLLHQNSLITKSRKELYSTSEKNDLNFIVFSVKINNNEDIQYLLEKSFSNIIYDLLFLNEDITKFLTEQQIIAENFHILQPDLLSNATLFARSQFKYLHLHNLVKDVYKYNEGKVFKTKIHLRNDDCSIKLYFYDQETGKNFYTITDGAGHEEFEDDLIMFKDILKNLSIKYTITTI